MKKNFFQVGGALRAHSACYIEREADTILLDLLRNREYAYILQHRQVGKSSLRVRCYNVLKQEGFKCVSIDFSSKGSSKNIIEIKWYYSLLHNIVKKLGLSKKEFDFYWELNQKLTIIDRFKLILDELILEKCQDNIIIFLDEIDSLLDIKNVDRDDFFTLIRSFYNLRAEDIRYERITFVLLGVVSPNDLMKNSNRTPFNIATSVQIEQFTLEQSYHFIEGLQNQIINKKEIIKKVFEWTSGTSYLTQMILKYITKNPIKNIIDIDEVVKKTCIEESSNEINIVHIQERILRNDTHCIKMIYLLARIEKGCFVKNDTSKKTIIYLKLTGLLKVENDNLIYANKIYQTVFNRLWINNMLERIERPIAKDFEQWLSSNKLDKYLLIGEDLEKISSWADNREDLLGLEHSFLAQSRKKEAEKKYDLEKNKMELVNKKIELEKNKIELRKNEIGKEKKKIELRKNEIEKEKNKIEKELLQEKKKSYYKFTFLGTLLVISIIIFVVDSHLDKEEKAKLARENVFQEEKRRLIVIKDKEAKNKNEQNQIHQKLNELILDSNPKLELYKKYNIPKQLNDKNSIKNLIDNSLRLSKEFDKKFWIKNIERMSQKDTVKLFNILKHYAYMDKADDYSLENKYEEAIKFYKRAIDYNNKKSKAYIQLGKIYFNLKKYTKTIGLYKKINNKDKKICFLMGSAYTKLKEYNDALKYYKEILKEDSENIKALFKIAEIYLEQKNYEKAIQTYKNIIKLKPKEHEAYAQIANVHFSQKDYKEAMKYYDKAIKISPNSSLIRSRDLVYQEIKKENIKISNFYQRGVEANEIGDYINAITYFKQSKKTDFQFHNELGFSYCKLGRYDDARTHYNKSKKLNSTEAKIYELFGHLEYKVKEYKKSIENYNKSIKRYGKDRNIDTHLYSAYIAFFHQQLIKNNEINNTALENSFKEYFKDKKEFLAYYEALKLLEKTFETKEKVNIDNWLKKYKEVSLNSKDLEFIHLNWIEKIKKNSLRFEVDSKFKVLKNAVPKIEYISFFKAMEEAKKEQKIVIIFVGKIGCPWCDKLEEEAQNSLALKKMIYEHFKIVRVDRDNLPMNLSLSIQEKSPVLIFIEAKNKLEVQKYSNIYFEDLSSNMEEDIKEWKDKGYLKRSIRDEKIERFTREGWLYVGKYKKEKWLECNLKFDKGMKPNDITDIYMLTKNRVNVRTKASAKAKFKSGLKKGYEVHVKSIALFGNYVWARIKY